ncbi:1680_t:CDS:2 [Funneliformis geosporum]|nr:1680_t:CDS:2 [Funneliformis geosporum]
MATLPDVLQSIALFLAQIPQYVGQELPDDYYNKVMQVINYDDSLGVAVFNDGVKTNVLAGKMAGRFTSPNPFNNIKLGSAQASMKALMTNKFLSIDTLKIYEK